MTTEEKIKYLIDKHNDEYLLKKKEVEANILNEIIARELSNLIPKRTRKKKGEK